LKILNIYLSCIARRSLEYVKSLAIIQKG
jgi:hypothetical protein